MQEQKRPRQLFLAPIIFFRSNGVIRDERVGQLVLRQAYTNAHYPADADILIISPMPSPLDSLKFDDKALIPAIIQDFETKDVLMFAFMNRFSFEKTVETGLCHYWSRSRGKLWLKGETSGHLQKVRSIRTDCDQDVLLIEVEQIGVACHDGYRSCFYRQLSADQSGWTTLDLPRIDLTPVNPKTVHSALP